MASTSRREAVGAVVAFNRKWEEAWLFTEYGGCAKCLVCGKTLTRPKQFNLKRHYNQSHAIAYKHFTREQRLQKNIF